MHSNGIKKEKKKKKNVRMHDGKDKNSAQQQMLYQKYQNHEKCKCCQIKLPVLTLIFR